MEVLIVIGQYILGGILVWFVYWLYYLISGLFKSFVAQRKVDSSDLNLFDDDSLLSSFFGDEDMVGLFLCGVLFWPIALIVFTVGFLCSLMYYTFVGLGIIFDHYFIGDDVTKKKRGFFDKISDMMNKGKK